MGQALKAWNVLSRWRGIQSKAKRRSPARRVLIEPLERRELLALSIGIDTLPAVAETTAQLIFPVNRNGTPAELSSESQVRYFTASNTAVSTADPATTDFFAASGTLTFSAGETRELVTVTIAADVRVEANETFLVKLADPTAGATLDASKAESVVTILDNDQIIVVGPDADGPLGTSDHTVRVYEATGVIPVPVKYSFQPYGPFWYGGIRVASGDFNADGIPDIVTGAGPGATSHVQVFRGKPDNSAPVSPQDVLRSFIAYPGFGGGVYVASGDVNGDGVSDLITAAGEGGGPHVKVFNGATTQLIREFMAWNPAQFSGGVRLAAADFNGDGRADIVAAQGPATQPNSPNKVKVFSGLDNQLLLNDLEPYPGFMAGLYVAAGDTNGDSRAELITAAGAATHVKIYDGATLPSPIELYGFFAYPGFGGGARVGTGDLNGDALAEIITSPGPGGGPHIKAFTHRGVEVLGFMSGGFTGGIYVDSEAAQTARGHVRIIDNSQAGFSHSGGFTLINNGGFLGGSHYAPPPGTSATATWTFNNLVPGLYRVSTTYTVHVPSRPADAPYTVFNGTQALGTATVNQQASPNDFEDARIWWETLGGPQNSYLITGNTLKVTVQGDADQWTSADAVRIERLAATPLITIPAAQNATEYVAKTFSNASGTPISIKDEDAGNTSLQTTLSVTVLVQPEVEMRGVEVAYTQTLEHFHEQAASSSYPR